MTIRDRIVSRLNEEVEPVTHKTFADKGYYHNNVGGMSDPKNKKYAYVKSIIHNGDDHRFYIFRDDSGKAPAYKVSHKVSKGYWSYRYENPELHKEIYSKDHKSAKRAISDIEKRFVPIHKEVLKAKAKKKRK